MFNNYAKTAIRGMRRHWTYTLINVTGLAVGFIAGFFILLWVSDEMSFNSGYDDGEQVYRVMRTSRYGPAQVFTWPAITAKLDDVLDENYPEIELAALMSGG
ncbi:MAG: putative ABC transport system permease protein [Rhodothermales bacterium]|jgi:putative ABC transport system permease protein